MRYCINVTVFTCLITVLLITSPFTNIFAQAPTDFFSLNYSFLPKKEFKDISGKSEIHYFEANLITPAIKLSKRTTIVNAFNYKFYHYNFEEMPAGWDNLPEQLHDIQYRLILREQLNANWSILVVPRINIRSDLKDGLSGDDFFAAVTTLVIHSGTHHSNFKWGIGVSYNNDFRHNTVVPVLSFSYITEKMRVNLLLPNNGQFIITPSKKLEYGLSFNVDPAIYHISTDSINNNPSKYIHSLNAYISPVFSYNFAGKMWLNLRAGYVLLRKYDVWDKDYEAKEEVMKNNLKSGMFASIGISMRLNTH